MDINYKVDQSGRVALGYVIRLGESDRQTEGKADKQKDALTICQTDWWLKSQVLKGLVAASNISSWVCRGMEEWKPEISSVVTLVRQTLKQH